MRRHEPNAWLAVAGLVFATTLALSTAGCDLGRDGGVARAEPAPALPLSDRGLELDDAVLHLAVRGALLEHLGTVALGLEIDVDGDLVTLAGDVPSAADEELATEVALSVDGVREVRSDVEVAAPPVDTPVAEAVGHLEHELADALLETRVKRALAAELGKVAFDLEVEASEGRVSLRGEVPDAERHELALRLARNVSGVDEVLDLIDVAS
jgi:osmotically-inducible protein OsmY